MTATVVRLKRSFRFGGTILPDFDPSLAPDQILAHFRTAYPALAMAELSDPVVEGDCLVYAIVKRTVQVKGAALKRLTPKEQELLKQLSEASEAEAESQQDGIDRWNHVATFTSNLLKRAPTPVADAMMVPML